MKFKNWLKSLDYRHYICIAITLAFVATSILHSLTRSNVYVNVLGTLERLLHIIFASCLA